MPIYLARAGDKVKIGYTRGAPKKRLSQIAKGLVLARVVDGPQMLETAFHSHYARQRLHGEWFRWSDDMMTIMPEELRNNRPIKWQSSIPIFFWKRRVRKGELVPIPRRYLPDAPIDAPDVSRPRGRPRKGERTA